MKRYHHWFIILFIGALLMPASTLFAQKGNKIKILGAKEAYLSESKYGDLRILSGNVRFKHQKSLMYCDSAVLNPRTNNLNAYGNVRIVNKSDKTEMKGDSLRFNGSTRVGQLRGNIELLQGNQVLKTRHLDFNTSTNIAHYYGGGTITNPDENSVLKSRVGHFYSNSQTYFFKDSVSYVTDEFEIYSDTLEYRLKEERVVFHGPTDIYSDSNSISCSDGWYDKKNDLSTFSEDVVITSPEQTLFADSVMYYRKAGIGKSFGNVILKDTINKMEIRGEYAVTNNKKKTNLVTGKMELILAFSEDSLYLHSDTLFSDYDPTRSYRRVHAYHHVQFYKSDLQGKCDSLEFSELDSTIRMYKHPAVWSEANQITGKEIIIKTYDGVIESMRINEEAFITSEEAPDMYNQIKGKSLFAHFRDNEIYKIDVNRSGQTIYYVRDEAEKIMGMNRLDCSNMTIFLDERSLSHIKFYKQPSGTFHPMKNLSKDLKLLRYFYWRIDERPTSREAIFDWTEVPTHVVLRRPSR